MTTSSGLRPCSAWLLCAAIAVAGAARADDAAGDAASDATAFFEPFDALDEDRWFVSDGWTNGPHQSCQWQRDRVGLGDGMLRLALETSDEGDLGLGCAEIQSNAQFLYGTFEARMKVPYATGMNANMFTFVGAPQDQPHNELDFEFIAPDGPSLQTNVHFEGEDERAETIAMADDGQFRVFSMIWEPDAVRWFIDGTLIREARGGRIPDQPQKLYLSLWSTDTLVSWMGAFAPDSAPQVLEVDWVAYTPAGAACQFDESILCSDAVDDVDAGAE